MLTKPRVLIIGLGLIGASFGKALREAGAAEVFGCDLDPAVPGKALELGVIDHPVLSLDAVTEMDVAVLAVPVMAMGETVLKIRHLLPGLTALTDVGSVKQAVVDAIRDALGSVPECLVPGHPIAGAEKSGVTAATSDLFQCHMHILTPLPETDSEATALVSSLWQQCGSQVVEMSVARHDEVLAATSHLPHLLAFSLVDTLARESENREIFKYAAGGFRDFSRIAASDATMWHDIFLMNSESTLKILRRFQSDLHLLEEAIEHRDSDLLHTVFTRAKSARDYFTEIMESRQKISD